MGQQAFHRRDAFMFAFVMALGACSAGGDLPLLPDQATETYHLGPGDVVRVITVGEQQTSNEFTVSDKGNIEYPLLGTVHAEDLSTGELQDKITEGLIAKGILRSPSVSVQITRYRPIFVLGEVNKPGEFPFEPGMNVLSAVAVAGGFTYRAVKGYVGVLRRTPNGTRQWRARPDSRLQAGDVITVFERII